METKDIFAIATELGKALKADKRLVKLENAKKAYNFCDLNPQCNSTSYTPQYPFYATKTVTTKNVSSKAKLEISPNQYLFANTQIVSG